MAFGCSITAGEELKFKPTIPKLFAEYIDEPLLNYAKPGASNDQILFTAGEHIEPGHTILVGITSTGRIYWPHPDEFDMKSYHIDNYNNRKGMKETLETWYKYCYNHNVIEQYYLKRYQHLEKYCKLLGNKVYFFTGAASTPSLFETVHGDNWFTKISLDVFCDSRDLGRQPKGHPSSRAHKQYFEEMIKECKI